MFGVSGAGLTTIRHMQNGGKRARHSVDQWDRQSTPSYHDEGTEEAVAADSLPSDGQRQAVDWIFERADR